MPVIIDGVQSVDGMSHETHEGITGLYTTPAVSDVQVVHMDVEDIALTTGYMIIDLSDTTNWPHVNTDHIDLLYVFVDIDPDATFQGEVSLGFLENVDGTNGDFHTILDFHLDKKAEPIEVFANLGFYEMALETAHWFGPTTANDETWQTDVNLLGPDGNTSYPSGDGDLVMLVTRTAGEVSLGVTIGYRTRT